MSGYPDLSANAIKVLESRYLRRDQQRRIIETPPMMFKRVAKGISRAELMYGGPLEADQWDEAFTEMLLSLDFLPNSPTLMNAGTPLGQLSACFVLPVMDSIEGIFDALRNMALIQRTGGGTGFSFSELRPERDVVASTSGEASGPVSFMDLFDCTTKSIKQGGKRRGANMAVIRMDHPDIMKFIRAKTEDTRLENFNLSVAVTDAFMEAVRDNKSYPLIHPRTGRVTPQVKAREVFDAMADAAWQTGDPGLIFLDPINRANPTPQLGAIEATNPCGEIPLLPYEACNLGSINLSHMVQGTGSRTAIAWEKIEGIVHKAVRFLDDVVEVNNYPIQSIEEITKANRKIGLGVMGFAEMLIRLGIPYGSRDAIEIGGALSQKISAAALEASGRLAAERGVFPNWKDSIYGARGVEIRNATRTAIAPTGTIGIIADTSPSIEPLFALAYRRSHVLEDSSLFEMNALFNEYIERHRLNKDSLSQQIVEKGRLADVEGVPEDLKRLFVTALEIPAEQHLQIQAAFQHHVDNSVSKTINMPESATSQEITRAYLRAWELGLKGVTVYRYGSKSKQVLELGAHEEGYHYEHGSKCDPGECRV